MQSFSAGQMPAALGPGSHLIHFGTKAGSARVVWGRERVMLVPDGDAPGRARDWKATFETCPQFIGG